MTALHEAAQSAPDAPPATPSRAGRGRAAAAALARPLLLYAASRLLVLLAVLTGVRLPSAQTVPDPWPLVPSTGSATLDGLLRWDSAWYLHLVELGYAEDPGNPRNAFFPLLPLLVRGVAALPGLGPVGAGLLVAAATGAAATVGVWLLGRQLSGPAAADRMAALFAFFPGAIALSMVYAEGLLIALAAGVLLALDRHRWLLAGVLAALATAARPNALAVGAACAWAALVAVTHRRDDGRREWRALVAPALAPLGIVAFFLHLASVTGEPLAWFTAQREGWRERVDLAGQLERVALVIADPAQPEGSLNTWLPVAGMAVMAVAFLALARWRPSGPVVVYALAASAMVLASASIGARPRMVLGAFPLVMALAYVARGPVFAGLLAVSAGTTALLTVLTVASLAATP